MSRNRYIFDSATALRAIGQAAVTATGNSASVELPRSVAKSNTGFAHLDVAAVVDVAALDTVTGDETYEVALEADTSAAFGAPVKVARIDVKSTGRHVLVVEGDTVEKLKPGTTHLRIKTTLAGTTPSIVYSAYLAPHSR